MQTKCIKYYMINSIQHTKMLKQHLRNVELQIANVVSTSRNGFNVEKTLQKYLIVLCLTDVAI